MFSELFSKYFFKLHTKGLSIPPTSWNSITAYTEIKNLLKDKNHQDEVKVLILDFFIYDLNYAIEKHLEADLWNSIKKTIENFKIQIRTDNSSRLRSLFTNFLNESQGIYFRILQNFYDINEAFQNISTLHANCSTLNLDTLHFIQNINSSLVDVTKEIESSDKKPNFPQKILCRPVNASNQAKEVSIISCDRVGIKCSIKPSKKNILFITQHCCVHIGDLYRYMNELELSEKFYQIAINLDPNSGHAYNQMAIAKLSNNSPSKILDILFNYVISFSCKQPFLSAEENLKGYLSMEKENNHLPSQIWIYHSILTYFYHEKYSGDLIPQDVDLTNENIQKLLFLHLYCGEILVKLSEKKNNNQDEFDFIRMNWATQTRFLVQNLLKLKDNSSLYVIFKWIQLNEFNEIFQDLKKSMKTMVELKLEARFNVKISFNLGCLPSFRSQESMNIGGKISRGSLYNLVEWSRNMLKPFDETDENKADAMSRTSIETNKSLILTAKEG